MRGQPGDPIDDDLTIHIHARGSFYGAAIAYSDAREDGSVSDVSATPLFFEVGDGDIRKALAANPADPLGRSFPDLSAVEVAGLPEVSKWAIFDESAGRKLFLLGGEIRKFS